MVIRERDLQKICPACRKPHNGECVWKPEFWKEHHYKTTSCDSCGHKIFFRTEHIDTGHY